MKDTAIQQIRVGSMLLIVVYHCVCYYGIWAWRFPNALRFESIVYWKAICNIALTAFVFISGLLYAKLYVTKEKYRNRKLLLKDKMHRLLFPYLIWSSLALLLFPSDHLLEDLVSGVQHLWFLLMLMSIFLLVIGLRDNMLKIRILMGGGVLFIILNVIVARYGSELSNIGAWKTAIRYLPAFICGILTVRLQLAERIIRWSKPLQLLTFAVSAILVFTIMYIPSLPLGKIYGNLPIYCFLICLYALLSIRPIRLGQHILDNLDKHSMGIYIIHHLLIWCALIYIPGISIMMDSHYIVAPTILFVTIFSLSWLFSAVISKSSYTKVLFNTRFASISRPATD